MGKSAIALLVYWIAHYFKSPNGKSQPMWIARKSWKLTSALIITDDLKLRAQDKMEPPGYM